MESYIKDVDILDESKDAFLTYAEEVLTDRAIPAAEDGLLSAQRKIIWTMEEVQKMTVDSKFKKSANIVGQTMSTSYYHGDASCYNVLCKMSQEYLMRYPLVKGEGSLGTQEANDMQASARYTNAKPNIYADLMMNDYKKNVVQVKPTYNNEYMEPVVLPSLFPNALVNGREAIGVSMAHNSLPMNLTEVCNGIIDFIEREGNITVEELMENIQGPDFPLGGTVMNSQDILHAFKTGKSAVSLKVRGNYEFDGDNKIIFTSIPYRTYRNKIKEQIAKNVDALSEYIEDFNDESSIGENRLVFFTNSNVELNDAVEALCRYTDLQTTLSYNMNFIVNGTPKLCSLYDLVSSYVNHQTNVLINATTFDLTKEKKELHILRGLLLILRDLDAAIETIRNSKDKSEAIVRLIEKFNVDEEQAENILNMKLSRLTKLENEKIEQKIAEKEKLVEEYEKILSDKDYRDKKLISLIADMRDKYGDERRTKLLKLQLAKKTSSSSKPRAEKIAEPIIVVYNLERQTIKKISPSKYKVAAGCVGVVTDTLSTITMFTDMNRTLRVKVKDIPMGTNTSIGSPINDVIELPFGEKVVIIEGDLSDKEYLVIVTKSGLIKKTPLSDYNNSRTGRTTKLRDGDRMICCVKVKDENMILATKYGRVIRLTLDAIPQGKKTVLGNRAIKFDQDEDEIAFAAPIYKGEEKIIFNVDGRKAIYRLDEFSCTARNSKGRKITDEGIIESAIKE